MEQSDSSRLLKKLLLVFAPLALMVGVGLVFIKPPLELQKESVELRIRKLISESPKKTDIVIGGDSRAEYGIIPALLEQQTGLTGVNLAVGAGNLRNAYAALEENGLVNGKRLLIFNISISDINDGEITFLDRVVIDSEPLGVQRIRDEITYDSFFLYYYYSHLKDFLRTGTTINPDATTAAVLENKGYFMDTHALELPLPESTFQDDIPWYTNVHLRGTKWMLFERTLAKLGDSNDRVVLYKAPLAPAWEATFSGSDIPTLEAEFSEMVRQAIAPYPNLHYLDFLNEEVVPLTDANFTDTRHLNKSGAEIFTRTLSETLGKAGLLTE